MNRPPNILWIGVDQLRYDTPGCNGNGVCQTPNIDRLAASGVCFDRAYTPSSLCTPARASMLTGAFAFDHGLITNSDMYHAPVADLPRPETLLHHRLASAGYRCGWIGKGHIGAHRGPTDFGFEGFSPPGYGDIRRDPEFLDYLRQHQLAYTLRDLIHANPGEQTCVAGIWDGPVESTPEYYLAERTNDLLGHYAADGRPFFLSVQFWGPHQPHLPSREFAGLHDRAAIDPWPNFADDEPGKPAMVRRIPRDFYRTLPRDWDGWREIVGRYYDCTAMLDAQIGRLLDRLDALGLAENTLVVFTSDHGDMTGAHGGANDKGLMYEEAHRIPLIIAAPGVAPRGARSGALVYNMDIFPTLLEALGLAADTPHGRSFLPVLRDPAAPAREEIYLEFHGIRFLYSQRGMVTADGWKYIFTPGDTDEVYDLNTDPAELRNRIEDPACADRVEALRGQLMNLANRVGDPLAPCVGKYFGHWDLNPRQIDATRI
jgi:choline-sulfatase